MKYREKFGYTHEQMRTEISLKDFLQDLQMMALEAEHREPESKTLPENIQEIPEAVQ